MTLNERCNDSSSLHQTAALELAVLCRRRPPPRWLQKVDWHRYLAAHFQLLLAAVMMMWLMLAALTDATWLFIV